ncbi:uncharacterized protein LOC132897833 [Neoarius graeffei]|uniref:uncharacterized protein LOC132897833 n=1 Tax=Neoarius graeffei TaxID=443677 RepID=UPI00298CA2F9|nr:uncharacterized protein LOC132897833 [Neoarius graeffei]
MCWSTGGGAGSHDKIYPKTEISALDKRQSKRESALLRNQPLTLIKVPETSTHETHDAIVAQNAAAIISNIKLQSEQKKRTQTKDNTNRERDSTSLSRTAGAKADKANIAEQSVTASCCVEGETVAHMKPRHAPFAPLETTDDFLSQPHTLSGQLCVSLQESSGAPEVRFHQAISGTRETTPAQHTHRLYHQLSTQGQRESFGSSSE